MPKVPKGLYLIENDCYKINFHILVPISITSKVSVNTASEEIAKCFGIINRLN